MTAGDVEWWWSVFPAEAVAGTQLCFTGKQHSAPKNARSGVCSATCCRMPKTWSLRKRFGCFVGSLGCSAGSCGRISRETAPTAFDFLWFDYAHHKELRAVGGFVNPEPNVVQG